MLLEALSKGQKALRSHLYDHSIRQRRRKIENSTGKTRQTNGPLRLGQELPQAPGRAGTDALLLVNMRTGPWGHCSVLGNEERVLPFCCKDEETVTEIYQFAQLVFNSQYLGF